MPPFNMTVDGKVAGIATERLVAALDRAAIPYRISVFPWLRAYDMALKDPYTCVYSTNRTPEREPLFNWVGPLAQDSWVVFAMAQNPRAVASIEDLRGYRVGSAKGDALALHLRALGFELDDVVHPDVPANLLNLRKLQSGRIDFWAAGQITATYTAAQFGGPPIKQVLELRKTALYLACNKSVPDALIEKLNVALARDQGLVRNIATP